jgi:hypothetical protein
LDVFLPQFGDLVIYVHRANIRGITGDPIDYQFKVLALCQILSLEIVPDGYILGLVMTEGTGSVSFRVYFSFTEHCDFLFPRDAYWAHGTIPPRLSANANIVFGQAK